MNPELNLLKDPIPSLIKKIALPASIGTLFQTLFNVVDTFFAGTISPEALSALAKSFPIYFTIIAASIGVTVAGTSLIGNSIGEKNEKKTFIDILGFDQSSALANKITQDGILLLKQTGLNVEVLESIALQCMNRAN